MYLALLEDMADEFQPSSGVRIRELARDVFIPCRFGAISCEAWSFRFPLNDQLDSMY